MKENNCEIKDSKTIRRLIVLLLSAVALICVGIGTDAHAAVKGPTATVAVSDSAKLIVSWTAPQNASSKTHYILRRQDNKGVKTDIDVTGGKTTYTEDTDNLTPMKNYHYKVAYYYNNDTGYGASDGTLSGFGTSAASAYTGYIYKPSGITLKKSSLTINKGKKRTLRVYTESAKNANMPFYQFYFTGRAFCKTISTMPKKQVKLYGTWKSSDESVATVSASGQVTAVSPGTATIKFTSIYGNSDSAKITVPSSDTMAGSIYIREKNEFINRTVLGSKYMIQGTQNRLNGYVTANYKINKIYVNLTDAKGKVTNTYSRTINSKGYTLSKLSVSVPFSDLACGTHYVKIYADYASSPFGSGVKTRLYSQKFYVCTKSDFYSRTGYTKGQAIGLWALTRLDDPYSMSSRGSSNYTDCSYLTLWSVRQALGDNAYSDQPRADLQYKYLVKKGKTIKKSSLKMGDMVFFANGSSWYYKSIGHIEVYLGNDLTAGAGYPGYCLIDTYTNTCKTIYYGRPY